MSAFKAAYLIHGDDHGRIVERRASLRRIAHEHSGPEAVELLEGEAATPASVAATLAAMTFALGRRFIIVDGVEGWKETEVAAALAPLLADPPPETTVAFFAREDGRRRAPKALHAAVVAAGGDVAAEGALKARELPRWAADQAVRLGLRLDGAAAQALVAQVGERRQRLLRELEKLALEHGEGAAIGVEEVEASVTSSAARQAWSLADALVAGDRRAALAAWSALRAQGEEAERLLPLMARRLREVQGIAERLEAGESPADVKRGLRMSPYAADRRLREARGADTTALRGAICALAALELAARGASELETDTEAVRTILAAAV